MTIEEIHFIAMMLNGCQTPPLYSCSTGIKPYRLCWSALSTLRRLLQLLHLLSRSPIVFFKQPTGTRRDFTAPPEQFDSEMEQNFTAFGWRSILFLWMGVATSSTRRLLTPLLLYRMKSYGNFICGITEQD